VVLSNLEGAALDFDHGRLLLLLFTRGGRVVVFFVCDRVDEGEEPLAREEHAAVPGRHKGLEEGELAKAGLVEPKLGLVQRLANLAVGGTKYGFVSGALVGQRTHDVHRGAFSILPPALFLIEGVIRVERCRSARDCTACRGGGDNRGRSAQHHRFVLVVVRGGLRVDVRLRGGGQRQRVERVISAADGLFLEALLGGGACTATTTTRPAQGTRALMFSQGGVALLVVEGEGLMHQNVHPLYRDPLTLDPLSLFLVVGCVGGGGQAGIYV
jgi:hypothetical protein